MRYLVVILVISCTLTIGCAQLRCNSQEQKQIDHRGDMLWFVRPEQTHAAVNEFRSVEPESVNWKWDEDWQYETLFVWLNTRLRYFKDPENDWQLPKVTWAYKGGDCEDLSFFVVSFLREAGSTRPMTLYRGTVLTNSGHYGHIWFRVEIDNYDVFQFDVYPLHIDWIRGTESSGSPDKVKVSSQAVVP